MLSRRWFNMNVSGFRGMGGVIVEVDGLCGEGNSIPQGIDFKDKNLTPAVRVCIPSAVMLLPLFGCTLLHLLKWGTH